MDGKIVQLAHNNPNPEKAVDVPPVPNPDIIEKLETLLAEAKEGKIQGFAIAAWTNTKEAKTTYVTGGHFFEVMAAVTWLGARLQKVLTDSED